ncbi:MAG: pyruvate, phosphate dikinase [Eubacterium sp.]|nr:pyruvate, phosphate dikinase [Eubacterium sp.]
MSKFVYSFNEGSKEMKGLLGGKGANLAEMVKIGLPVPFGFTVTTEACNRYYEDGGMIDEEIIKEIFEKVAELESVTGKGLGFEENPLLVSVRSGSVFSMPGMMDTVLNLGLNDVTVESLVKNTGNRRFAFDSYRRFIQMYSDVVMNIENSKFDKVFESKKAEKNVQLDIELNDKDLEEIVESYKILYREETGQEFPQNPEQQLIETVKAVFRSWNNERAILYRKLNDIPNNLGTAVNVQSMVFGNSGDNSATGVAFSRNSATGAKELYGEFLVNAQGEDIVAGIRTPLSIKEMEGIFPKQYESLAKIAALLEKHYKDMQDIEFTIEENKLYILQTRNGKRTVQAAVNIAVDMVNEELIDKKTALMRISPDQIGQMLHPVFDKEEMEKAVVAAAGLPASPGAASGKIYFNADDIESADKGEKAILVREETSPEDLAGMVAADGILTARGGRTSHAAVVARGMGKCCITGCKEVDINEEEKTLTIGDIVLREGDSISLDGDTGNVYIGEIKTVVPELDGNFNTFIHWADEVRNLKVRTNADNPRDAKQAVEFGAEGIGLCRTEHMFFDEERIADVRRMILASNKEEREEALSRLLPYQIEDFKGIFEVMEGRPVNIRLLDPPLHEFLPNTYDEIQELAKKMEISFDQLYAKVKELQEVNPMLGHRGCRLAATYPEIAVMQATAIATAAVEVKKELNLDVEVEIMIPLASVDSEIKVIKAIVVETVNRIAEENEVGISYQVGTMIEIPRAALTADEIAKEAEFFSFGTNDLTQMTFGFSRDDTSRIIEEYVQKGILKEDPFQTIDRAGVGKLMKTAIELGRKIRPNIKLGICGEHGGEAKSIAFCNELGLNYVSCSPYRVPSARLAAAQAVLQQEEKED